MKVYVLLRGERCEGGWLLGVYSSLRSAKAAARKIPSSFEPWQKKHTNYWTSGCDFLEIIEHDVKESG